MSSTVHGGGKRRPAICNFQSIPKIDTIARQPKLRDDQLEKHIFGLSDLIPTIATVVAILACSVVPVYAQSQQPDTAKLKAEAQNALKIISSDKLKVRIFCEMADLGDQLEEADRVHDTKEAQDVSQKMDELEDKLPEYTALMAGLGGGGSEFRRRSGDRFDNFKARRTLQLTTCEAHSAAQKTAVITKKEPQAGYARLGLLEVFCLKFRLLRLSGQGAGGLRKAA